MRHERAAAVYKRTFASVVVQVGIGALSGNGRRHGHDFPKARAPRERDENCAAPVAAMVNPARRTAPGALPPPSRAGLQVRQRGTS